MDHCLETAEIAKGIRFAPTTRLGNTLRPTTCTTLDAIVDQGLRSQEELNGSSFGVADNDTDTVFGTVSRDAPLSLN